MRDGLQNSLNRTRGRERESLTCILKTIYRNIAACRCLTEFTVVVSYINISFVNKKIQILRIKSFTKSIFPYCLISSMRPLPFWSSFPRTTTTSITLLAFQHSVIIYWKIFANFRYDCAGTNPFLDIKWSGLSRMICFSPTFRCHNQYNLDKLENFAMRGTWYALQSRPYAC